MNVILLTVFVGLILVTFFILLFIWQGGLTARGGQDRDALLPFADETPRPAKPSTASLSSASADSNTPD